MGRRAILGLFSLALTALLIEVGARLILALVGPGNAPIEFGWKPSGGRASTFRDRVYVPDSRVFFRLSPNLDIEITSNPRIFDLHTDSRGMRSPEPAIPKPSGNYRVLAIGDSCTFGSGAGQSGTYPMQLERHLLGMRNKPRFEVLNAGVPGFTSFQSLGLFEMEGAALSPDAVIFASGYNDASPATAGSKRPFGSERMMSDRAYAESLRRSQALGFTRLLWRAGFSIGSTEERIGDSPPAKHRVSVREYGANLRSFVDLSRARGAMPVLVVWPRRSQISSPSRHEERDRLMDRYHEEMRRVGRTANVAVLDLKETLQGREDLFVDIIHLNAHGYGLVAEALAKIVLADVDRRAASRRQ